MAELKAVLGTTPATFESLQRSIELHLNVAARAADLLVELAAQEGALDGIEENRNRGKAKWEQGHGPSWHPASITDLRSLRSRVKALHREIGSYQRRRIV